MEKNVFALESFKNIQDLIKFVDQKSGGVLVVSGFILTVFLDIYKELNFNHGYCSLLAITTIAIGIITVLLLIYTIYLSIFKILKPRLAIHYAGNDNSLFYFNHLASMTDKTVMFDQFKNINDDLMLKNVTDQIFEVSKILDKKIIELHNSMNCLFFSIVSLVIFIVVSRFI